MSDDPEQAGTLDGVSLGIAVTVVLLVSTLIASTIWQPQLPEGPRMEKLPIPGITAPASGGD